MHDAIVRMGVATGFVATADTPQLCYVVARRLVVTLTCTSPDLRPLNTKTQERFLGCAVCLRILVGSCAFPPSWQQACSGLG